MSTTEGPPPAPPLYDGPLPQEPALTRGTIGTVVSATATLLVVFAAPLTHDQQLAILGVVASLLPIVMAAITRGAVYSPESVRLLMRSTLDKKACGQ